MAEHPLLSHIQSPKDLKQLKEPELRQLCSEVRETLIETVAETGGHLSSNLGIVELTVALHWVFDTPHDQIVWDVGHQCYVHKLLTGRADRFHTLRREGGLTGFPCPQESEYDTFVVGHSSTAVSCHQRNGQGQEIDRGRRLRHRGDGGRCHDPGEWPTKACPMREEARIVSS